MLTPKQAGFHMPAEWFPHAACWMAWPSHQKTWADIGLTRAYQAYANIANAIAQYEPVMLLINPGDIPIAKKLCTSAINLVPLAINDSWTRDTGPSFLINQNQELAGIDWIHNAWGRKYEDFALDNQIAAHIISSTKAQYFAAPLVMEGGAFHVDGAGSVLTTRACLFHPNRNPTLAADVIEDYLRNYLNAEKIIWLNKGLVEDETDGHVDEIACFIAPAKVLALTTDDQNDVNYPILQENIAILKAEQDAQGRSLEIYTVAQPPATYIHGRRLTLSYINFYLANTGIVMPSFGYAKYDAAARSLFAQLFPQHHITQIEALDIFAGGGGIHCITQQQPLT